MKIAFIVGLFPALSATFIQNQITGLLDLGFDVQVFAGKNPKESKVHLDFVKYNLNERVSYFSIPLNKKLRLLKGIILFFKHIFKEPWIILKSLNIIKYGKAAISLNLFYQIIPFVLQGNKFDIIHCHFGPNGNIGASIKELGIRGKLITTFYGYDLSLYLKENNLDVYKKLFAIGDLFLPICTVFKQKLIDLGCSANKIQVHPVGIDLEKYRIIDRRSKYKNDRIYILSVGRFCKKKGFEYGIRAFAKLCDDFNNIHYLIAGDGLLKKQLVSLVKELNIQKYVEFVGVVDQNELIDLYNKSHVFLLPSITDANGDQEGTPTVILEAQAMGLPVVSTWHSGIPEIIMDGQSGFLVAEKDIEGLVKQLKYLLLNKNIWIEMGKKGRIFIEKNFDIKVLIDKLKHYYL